MTSEILPPQHINYVTQGYVINHRSNARLEKYTSTVFKLGITQVVLSILSLTFGIAVFVYAATASYYDNFYDYYAYLGTGIWCSGFIVAGLVMSIFSAIAATTLFVFELMATQHVSEAKYWLEASGIWGVSLAFHAVLTFIGAVEFFVAIIHCACSCGVQCCQPQSHTTAPRSTYAYVNPIAGQITSVPGQPPAYIQGPTIPVMTDGQVYQQPLIFTSALPQQQPQFNYQIQGMQPACAHQQTFMEVNGQNFQADDQQVLLKS